MHSAAGAYVRMSRLGQYSQNDCVVCVAFIYLHSLCVQMGQNCTLREFVIHYLHKVSILALWFNSVTITELNQNSQQSNMLILYF